MSKFPKLTLNKFIKKNFGNKVRHDRNISKLIVFNFRNRTIFCIHPKME